MQTVPVMKQNIAQTNPIQSAQEQVLHCTVVALFIDLPQVYFQRTTYKREPKPQQYQN